MQEQDVARFLLFSSAAQQHHPQRQHAGGDTATAGLSAQLHALRLKCALQAEALQQQQQQQPAAQPLSSELSAECARLLLAAGATPQAAEARAARCAAATAAAGAAGALPVQLPPGADVADALLRAVAGPSLLDQASKAQQLLAQASAVLQQRVAHKRAAAAAAAAALHSSGQQQRTRTEGQTTGAAAAATAGGQADARSSRRANNISVPPAQDRKRQLDGAPKGLQQQQQQPGAAAAAGARWGSTGGPTSAPKRPEVAANPNTGGGGPASAAATAAAAWAQPQQQQHQQQQQCGSRRGEADDPIEVDDDDDQDNNDTRGMQQQQQQQDMGAHRAAASNRWSGPPPPQPARRQQAQQPQFGAAGSARGQQQGGPLCTPPSDSDEAAAAAGGGGGGGRPGFKSARAQLVTDLRKKGQHQQANMFAAQQAGPPRAGLTRPRGGGAAGGGSGGGGGNQRSGFVPPFVSKAIDHHTGGGRGGGGGGGAAAAGGAGGEEGPLSARTLEMLGVGDDGELPAELSKHEPRLIEAVCNEVIDASGGVSWDDIAGLETAKHLIKEIVVWPMLNPHLFTGPRAPPKGILLFGPPGTGKTLIGKAVASNIQASFFSISASSLTSKWIGEGEKMVKTLFAVAGVMQPSVIFIDEIDSIMSARKADGEHESSRRLKTELLVQMEGCDPASTERRVLLVGATNRPEELDEAARRRLPKQLYIPLPCAEARRAMILRQLGKVSASLSPADLDKVVGKTDGYSGSDMRNLIQEACQGPVRSAVAAHGEGVANLCDADLRAVVLRDFQHAAKAQRASVTAPEIERYEQYNARHGAQYVQGAEDGAVDGDEDDDW